MTGFNLNLISIENFNKSERPKTKVNTANIAKSVVIKVKH